ncbi:MAG TPA: hypothetical protein VIJ69_00155 [Actinomycetota bacterium]
MGAVGLLTGGPASAQTPVASANYNGYASGAVVHTGVLNSGPTTLAELDQAFAGAAANSAGFASQIDSKINTVIQAADPSKKSGARGAGVELGIGVNNPVATASALITQKAVATAPPNSGLIDNKTTLALDPVLNATLAEGRAQANWYTDPQGNNGCALGQDISNGFGHLANATAVGSPSPSSSVVNAPGELSTTSHLKLVPQTDPSGATVGGGTGVGLMSENVQTYAPIALLGGAVTITVVGPIHLRAVATGIPGQAYMQYGPPDGTPGTTPILTIATPATAAAPVVITAQQLLGNQGLTIPLGVINITVATPPHALGGTGAPVAAADGTSVSGEVDLVSVTAPNLADVRVGHMEASATVPAGGILCQVDVSKEAQPDKVNPGDTFNYIIHVHNPHACTLTGVKVVDTVTGTSGVRFSILGEDPKADSATSSTLTWNDIGPLPPGATKDLVVHMKVASNSGGGTFTEKANVTASCAIANAQGSSTIAVPAAGSATIQLPTISGGAGRALPVTGGLTGRYYAVALLITLGALAFGRRGFKALMGTKG